MSFIYHLSWTEYALIGLVGLFYFFYLIRVARASKSMGSRTFSFSYKLILRSTYLALMIIALIGPSFGGKSKKEVKSVGKDIYFLVDLSRSMDAADIRPSRLEKTKFQLKNIVDAFSSDRTGLIVFASDAFVQCPLTFDKSAIMLFIETMRTGLVSNHGTDFAPALKLAKEKLIDETDSKGKKQTKILILISDGEDFGNETVSIAKEIEDLGIKVFTLGVGTQKGGKIPDGYKFKKDREGNDVVSTLNRKAMKKLSSVTDGKYFELSNAKNDVPRLISAINNIEGELIDARQIDVSDNKYFYFLFVAFLFMLLDLIVTVRVVKV